MEENTRLSKNIDLGQSNQTNHFTVIKGGSIGSNEKLSRKNRNSLQ